MASDGLVHSIATATTLVFGGCCTNAWSLERLLKDNQRVGSALTFCQLVFITLQSAPECVIFRKGSWRPRLKPPIVPIRTWVSQVFILTSMSLLNNWAFAFNVPLTLQIVFRSAGLAVSMILNRLFLHKAYTSLQVLSVTVVSLGVLLATLSRPSSSSSSSSSASPPDVGRYAIGIAMLSVATILTSTLGILQEKTYAKYGGSCWREGVFYTHLLSLPVFCIFIEDIKSGLRALSTSSPSSLPFSIPPLYLVLALNILSQSACVSGANLLNSNVSAVSTNLVLTARKALSLCISVWYFGQGLNAGLGVGAGMVLVGTVLYSYATARAKPKPSTKKQETAEPANGHANGHARVLTEKPAGLVQQRRGPKGEADDSL